DRRRHPRRAPRARPRARRGAAPRRDHHGRQRALGPRAAHAAPLRPPQRDEGGARGRRGRRRGRPRVPLPVRLLAGELAAPGDRGLGPHVAARGVHRAGSRRAGAARRPRARARRPGAAHPARGGRRAPRRRPDRAQHDAHAQPVHLVRRAGGDRARRAPPGARRRERRDRPRRDRGAGRPGAALHRRLPRPRPRDPHLGRAARLELPALADRVRRDLHLARALARLRARGALRRGARLPAARPAVRPRLG
ncbi:MAG: Undecaprenyl diphosphate synthase, partial [uncultured Gemmatimonadaceae bacterium]